MERTEAACQTHELILLIEPIGLSGGNSLQLTRTDRPLQTKRDPKPMREALKIALERAQLDDKRPRKLSGKWPVSIMPGDEGWVVVPLLPARLVLVPERGQV